MALRQNGAGVYRTTNLPATSTLTMMCWAKFYVTSPAGRAGILGLRPEYWIHSDYANRTLVWRISGSIGASGSTPAVDEWFHVGLVTNGTGTASVNGYYNGAAAFSPIDYATQTTTRFQVGSDYNITYQSEVDVAAVKVWNASLTQAEVQREMRTIRPQRTADLVAWLPYRVESEKLIDYSGVGNFSLDSGTFTTQDGPPIGWGASPLWMGNEPAAPLPPDYGTPYDHVGVWPFSSVWRAGRV